MGRSFLADSSSALALWTLWTSQIGRQWLRCGMGISFLPLMDQGSYQCSGVPHSTTQCAESGGQGDLGQISIKNANFLEGMAQNKTATPPQKVEKSSFIKEK